MFDELYMFYFLTVVYSQLTRYIIEHFISVQILIMILL